MTPPDDLPDELHVERVDNASARLRICAGPRDYTTTYLRADRNCLGCEHGTPDKLDALAPEHRTVECSELRHTLDIEIQLAPWSSGASLGTICPPGDFCCSLWQHKETT